MDGIEDSAGPACASLSNDDSVQDRHAIQEGFESGEGASVRILHLPGGVVTFAAKGDMASGPKLHSSQSYTLSVAVKPLSDRLLLNKYSFVSAAYPQPLVKALEDESVSRLNFQQWLGAEAVRLSYPDDNGILKPVSISREMMVKRVANTLDGSHASASAVETDNTFDAPVHHLLEYKVGGVSLPYFILLKIAQDILEHVPKLLPQKPNADLQTS